MFLFDQTISSKLDGLFDDRPRGKAWAIFCAKYLVWLGFGLIVLGYPFFNRQREGAFWYDVLFLAAVLVPHLLTLLVSLLVRRRRPYEHLPDMWHMPVRLYTYSFPSGHATLAFAAATFVMCYWHPVWWLAVLVYLAACFVALARVVVGVHYVTDVVAGALIGTGGSYLALWGLVSFFLRAVSGSGYNP